MIAHPMKFQRIPESFRPGHGTLKVRGHEDALSRLIREEGEGVTLASPGAFPAIARRRCQSRVWPVTETLRRFAHQPASLPGNLRALPQSQANGRSGEIQGIGNIV